MPNQNTSEMPKNKGKANLYRIGISNHRKEDAYESIMCPQIR